MLGIFERDGDDFKLCIDTTGDSRPKDFTAGTDSNRRLFICKRIPRKQEEHDLSGLYRSESTESDGSKHTADAAAQLKQLSATSITFEMPTISESLEAVRGFKSRRTRPPG